MAGYCEPEDMECLVGLILGEGFRTNSDSMAGVERLAVMVPDSAFLESTADDPIVFPEHSQSPSNCCLHFFLPWKLVTPALQHIKF